MQHVHQPDSILLLEDLSGVVAWRTIAKFELLSISRFCIWLGKHTYIDVTCFINFITVVNKLETYTDMATNLIYVYVAFYFRFKPTDCI